MVAAPAAFPVCGIGRTRVLRPRLRSVNRLRWSHPPSIRSVGAPQHVALRLRGERSHYASDTSTGGRDTPFKGASAQTVPVDGAETMDDFEDAELVEEYLDDAPRSPRLPLIEEVSITA